MTETKGECPPLQPETPPTSKTPEKSYELLHTTNIDWLLNNILHEKFQKISKQSQRNLLTFAYTKISELLIFKKELKISIAEDDLFNLNEIICCVLKEGKEMQCDEWDFVDCLFREKEVKEEKMDLMWLFRGFVLMNMLDQYMELFEKECYYTLLKNVRECFKNVKEFEDVKKWGLGLAYLFQGRYLTLDPEYKEMEKDDDRLKIFKLLMMKANVSLISSYYKKDKKNDSSNIWFLGYKTFSGYYISRVFGLLGSYNDCYYWFSRAKLDNNLPPAEVLLGNKDFSPMIFSVICVIINETSQNTIERTNFYNCTLDIEKKMSLIPSNLSESAIMKTALSKSTLNMLMESHNPMNDLFTFWKPVSESFKAKKRLQKRMAIHGVEIKREVPGDGNCQMHSLCDQLCDNFTYSRFIRRSIVNWLKANGDLKLVCNC
jgi:hypothetical protein